MFAEIVAETDQCTISRPEVLSDKRAAFPDICIDSVGNVWTAWVESTDAGEFVVAARIESGRLGEPVQLCEPGINLQPCIVSLRHGSVRVFWIHRALDSWQLLTRSIHSAETSEVVVVVENELGVFRPSAAVDSRGTCHVAVETVSPDGTAVTLLRQMRSSWVKSQLPESSGSDLRPELCCGEDDFLWLAHDSRTGAASKVVLYRINAVSESESASTFEFGQDGFVNLQPALCPATNGGVWLSYASNRNPAALDPAWLTKWSYVYHTNGSETSEPAAHRSGVDIYNEHAFQGWEFPAVESVENRAICVVGQSAHSLVLQYCSGDAWSDVLTIDTATWGSWKPRCRTASAGDTIYIVSMGLRGPQVSRVSFDKTDPCEPALVPVTDAPKASETSGSIEGVTADRPSTAGEDGSRLSYFFGDLHGHSVYSDATGDIDEFYFRYKNLYGYDFAALTDHDYLDGIELSPSELALIWNHAERFSADGEFIAWYGYEWTSPAISVHAGEGDSVGEGHRHVLYPDNSGPLVKYGRPDTNTGQKLLDKLAGVRALVIPHHTGWSGTDWDAHDQELQRVVEIVSAHGRFEFPGNQPIGYRRDHVHPEKFVLEALRRGYRLGFVGGSDSHGLRWHAIELEGRADHIEEETRVGWKEDAYRSGMTVILAESLTRSNLFDALYHRRCYATSGVPIVLDFRINGSLMGTEMCVQAPPLLTVEITGTDGLQTVEVVRGGHVISCTQFSDSLHVRKSSFELVDETLTPGESTYYYLRVTQNDENMAWSSPIWVKYE